MHRYVRTIAGHLSSARGFPATGRLLRLKFTRCVRPGCELPLMVRSSSDIGGCSGALRMFRKDRGPSPSSAKVLNFSEYDFVGFDLDHTLAKYNLKNLFTNHYNYLVNVLNSRMGYQLQPELTPIMVDFISRGLIIDIERGNLLKVAYDGEIVRASHGTRALDPQEIAKIYGSKRQWKALKDVMRKKFATWKSRGDEMYSFMDFTDSAVTAVYALAIDSGKQEKMVWVDVLGAVRAMYSDENWCNDIFSHADAYLYKTSEAVLKWVSQFRPNIKTALITSNWYDFVPRIAVNSIGPSWQSLFDFYVFNSKKPHFFSERTNFLDLTGKETEFTLSGNYSRGSIHGIIDALARNLNREPKCVYIGDSPMHDFMFTSIDYIAIVEELRAEGMIGTNHPSAEYISSKFWGSYMYEGDRPTLFGKIALDGQFCAPDLDYFAEKPIDNVFERILRRPHSSNDDQQRTESPDE